MAEKTNEKGMNIRKWVNGDPKEFIGNQLSGIKANLAIADDDVKDNDFAHLAFVVDSFAGYSRNIIEACRMITELGTYEDWLRYNVSDKSTKKFKTFNDLVKEQRNKNKCVNASIDKSGIDWDDLVEKGQIIKQLLDDIKKAISNNPDKNHSEESILMIIDEIEKNDLIYNLNWNLVSARTDHRHDNEW